MGFLFKKYTMVFATFFVVERLWVVYRQRNMVDVGHSSTVYRKSEIKWNEICFQLLFKCRRGSMLYNVGCLN